MPGAEPPPAPPPAPGAETSWWQRAAARLLSQRADFGTLAAGGACSLRSAAPARPRVKAATRA
jgi:hypothetical protein